MARSGRGSSGGGRSSSGRSSSSRSFSGGMSSSGRSARSSPSRSSKSYNNSYRPSYRPYYRPYRRTYYGGYSRNPSGCATIIVSVIILFVLLSSVGIFSNFNGPVTKNTIEREPLSLSMSKETKYYTDTLGWIKSPNKLEKGMKEFYKKTGVQPHLYIVDNIEGSSSPSNPDVEKWMDKKYDELFTDEAHLLMLFLDNGHDYGHWLLVGTAAKSVVDGDAQTIIHDYMDRYVTSNLDDEEMFSTVFSKSAESMMTVYKSPWVKVVIGAIVTSAGIIIVSIILKNNRKKKEQELKENQQTIDILNTPLDEIKDYNDLEDKYK